MASGYSYRPSIAPPRAIASKVTSGQYFSQIGVIPSGLEPFGLDADLGRLLLLEQTHGHLSQEGHIFRGMAGAYPGVVFAEDHIQYPVQGIFNAPMTAHRFTKPLGIVVQAGDLVASFHGDLIAYLSLGFDHTEQAQALPGRPIGKIVDRIGGPVTAGLDAAVVFIVGLKRVDR